MAVRIRMKKLGRRHRPFFRICVMDARSPRDGKAIEEIGTYDPMVRDKSQRVTLDLERVDHWISVGAQPSEKVAALIRKFKKGDWGSVKAPPPMTPPQVKAEPEPSEPEPSESESATTPESGSGETTAEAAPS